MMITIVAHIVTPLRSYAVQDNGACGFSAEGFTVQQRARIAGVRGETSARRVYNRAVKLASAAGQDVSKWSFAPVR